MYPKNIQEYIVQEIIKHNKYRDYEIQEQEKLLKDSNIDKCGKCMKYKKEMNVCHMCLINCCIACSKTELKHFNSSDTYDEITKEGFSSLNIALCNKCSLVLCDLCINSINM